MMRSSEFLQEQQQHTCEEYEECVTHRYYSHLTKMSDKDAGSSSS